MVRILVWVGLVFCFSCGDSKSGSSASAEVSDKIQWMTWEEAIEANTHQPKKFLIDMYTHWCGWCKKMDSRTFSDPEIAKMINRHFHPIKFNAEQKEDINYKNQTFSFVPSGRRGYHQLAGALLDGKLSYPSFVFMNEEEKRILVSPGFKTVEQMKVELDYIVDEKYKNMKLSDYKATKSNQ